MAAKLALSSSLSIKSPFPATPASSLFPPPPPPSSSTSANTRFSLSKIHANLGGGADGEIKKEGKKKFITRDEEPQQYWQTAGEREGENPMKTPLPYIIIFGMATPFVILAIAFANGWVKVPAR